MQGCCAAAACRPSTSSSSSRSAGVHVWLARATAVACEIITSVETHVSLPLCRICERDTNYVPTQLVAQPSQPHGLPLCMGSSKPFLARLNVASCLTSREAMGSSSGVSSGGDTAGEGVSTPGCPICEFIEAGPCGDQHKVGWNSWIIIPGCLCIRVTHNTPHHWVCFFRCGWRVVVKPRSRRWTLCSTVQTR